MSMVRFHRFDKNYDHFNNMLESLTTFLASFVKQVKQANSKESDLRGEKSRKEQLVDGKRIYLPELIAKRSKILEYVDIDSESEYFAERSSNFVDRSSRVASFADKFSIMVLSDDINTINVEIYELCRKTNKNEERIIDDEFCLSRSSCSIKDLPAKQERRALRGC